jgi:uncharacterized protein (TIGR02996 family)
VIRFLLLVGRISRTLVSRPVSFIVWRRKHRRRFDATRVHRGRIMPDFDEDQEFRALRRAARANPDDELPRLVLADWLEERGWAEEAAFYRTEISAALWRLENAVRELLPELLPLDLSSGQLPKTVAVFLLADGLNKAAGQIREAAAQQRAEQHPDGRPPSTPKKRPRRKPRRKK